MGEMQGETPVTKAAWPLCAVVAVVLLLIAVGARDSQLGGVAFEFGVLAAVLAVVDVVVRAVRRQPLR